MGEEYLSGSMYLWQMERIRCLSENDMTYPDMEWKVGGKIIKDIRSMYTSSSFLTAIFSTKMKKGIIYHPESDLHVYEIEEDFSIFQSIRIYCHTGIVQFFKGETILKTLERYSAFQMYDIEGGKRTLLKIISENITPTNATQAFEYAIHRDDSDLLDIVTEYFVNYAFVIFKHRSFRNLKMESISYLATICLENKLNIKEPDLLEHMYRLCDEKINEKEYSEFKNPIDIMKHKFGETSIWESIRFDNITIEEFMHFVSNHEGCIGNDDIVAVMKNIYTSPSTNKRKRFQMISSYPRNLNIIDNGEAQGDISHWAMGKIQVFFVFDCSKKTNNIALPPTLFKEWNIRCNIMIGKCIQLRGNVTMDGHNPTDEVRITAKIVNFKHDRWKKTIAMCRPTDYGFDIPSVLSRMSIDGPNSEGYMFDIAKYPEYDENGTWVMMSLMVERVSI